VDSWASKYSTLSAGSGVPGGTGAGVGVGAGDGVGAVGFVPPGGAPVDGPEPWTFDTGAGPVTELPHADTVISVISESITQDAERLL
jgi:hypothetical protein